MQHMSSGERTIPIPEVVDQACRLGTECEQTWKWLQRLYRRVEAYEPQTGYLRLFNQAGRIGLKHSPVS